MISEAYYFEWKKMKEGVYIKEEMLYKDIKKDRNEK